MARTINKTVYGNDCVTHGKDLIALLESLSLENVVLVGWSPGNLEVWSYLEQHGISSVKGAVTIDMSPLPLNADPAVSSSQYSPGNMFGFCVIGDGASGCVHALRGVHSRGFEPADPQPFSGSYRDCTLSRTFFIKASPLWMYVCFSVADGPLPLLVLGYLTIRPMEKRRSDRANV